MYGGDEGAWRMLTILLVMGCCCILWTLYDFVIWFSSHQITFKILER
jgi:hypothetical protein